MRGRKDAEGQFLRECLGERFFPTSSGYMACISPSGKSLGQNPKKALEQFQKLPDSERKAGAVEVGTLKADVEVAPPAPPPNGLVLKYYGRFLARGDDGRLRKVSISDFPLMKSYKEDRESRVRYLFEAHPDFVWLTESEWRAMIPDQPKVGEQVSVSEKIVRRICSFHLVPPRLYGEGGGWNRNSIPAAELKLTVKKVDDRQIVMSISGFAKLGSIYDAAKATTPNGPLRIGYEPRFDGEVVYDVANKRVTRFDMTAVGDCWGRMGDANGKSVSVERPGRQPIGFAFETADPSIPANRLIPAGRANRVRPGGVYWR